MSSDILKLPSDKLEDGQILRLYSMRMCPYAQRARLMLAAKNIKYDLVNIDLNKKPDWFFDLNPYGEVPVLLHNGGCVYESLITAEYIEEAFPQPKFYSDDPLVRAQEKIYFNHWTKKGIPAFYSLLKAGHPDPEQTKRLEEHVGIMDAFLNKLNKPYFHGDQVGFSDYMIWPWFERLPVLKDITEFNVSAEKYPHLRAWVDRMWKDPVVLKCMIDPQLMIDHYQFYRTGKPDFTLGAVKPAPVQELLENLDGLRDPTTRDRQK
ncbi:hypothetical protein BsWGS_14284 [Bradybaena similaris]